MGYETQLNSLYAINLTTGGTTTPQLIKQNFWTDSVNAMAYNSADNYMYAIAQKNNQNGYIVRIGFNGTTQQFGTTVVDSTSGGLWGVPASVTSGTIDDGNFYWVAWNNAKAYAKIDMNIGSLDYGKVAETGNTSLFYLENQAQYYTVNDWAFLGGSANRTGKLYAVAGQNMGNNVYKTHLLYMATVADPATIPANTRLAWKRLASYDLEGGTNPTTGKVGKADWGAMYPSNDGYLYATENTAGRVYRFNITSPLTAPQYVMQGPEGTTNDGARCVGAAIG